MQRTTLTRLALTVATVAVLMSFLTGLAAAAGSVPIEQAPLNPAGEAYEVNPGANGSVWISDYGAHEIWQAKANDTYTAYVLSEGMADALPGAAGEVWYAGVDNCSLSRLSTSSPGETTWSLGTGCIPQATAYDGSQVWVADFRNPQIFSFNGSSLCTYTLAGIPGYLGTQGGQMWFGDRTNGRIARLNPANGGLTSWQLSSGAKPFDVVAAPDNTIWWTDLEAGKIDHFVPATNQLTTYTLAAGSQPVKLAIAPAAVWYTDFQTHTVDKIDPAAASGTASTLAATNATLSPNCSTPASTPHTVTTRSGTLGWNAGAATAATANGITTYQLATTALPWGIAYDGTSLLIADRDPANHALERISAAVVPEDLHNKVYLPIFTR